MPTYDYQCGACDHTWELFQSITADPVKKCPACGKSKAKRLIGTGSSIIFKGSGFYTTDYRSDSYQKAAKAESEAASGKKPENTSSGGDGAAAKSAETGGTAASKSDSGVKDSPNRKNKSS